ncbi:hypothetical protein BO71DRAFT_395969 [Aspergillus ellipticus CBS 707.79]|uniref:Uncharacterized protein n=1 Tax=Aspergillus ellipticus CBS 707.79 TaxID=1448320 RepID=A0A319DJK5_9EURO|nr:hypothetical protein BO71DRAFT_395969 [Aspergillus ellipticus CBS 707.79]
MVGGSDRSSCSALAIGLVTRCTTTDFYYNGMLYIDSDSSGVSIWVWHRNSNDPIESYCPLQRARERAAAGFVLWCLCICVRVIERSCGFYGRGVWD